MLNLLKSFFFPKISLIDKQVGKYIAKEEIYKYSEIINFQLCHVCKKESRIGFSHINCLENSNLDGVISVVRYNKFAKKLIAEGKYKDTYEIFNELGEIIYQYVNKYYKLNDYLVTFVPLHWKKENYRGFNQAKILAKKYSVLANVESVNLLKRRKYTKKQAALGMFSRSENLVGAFELKNDSDLTNKKIIIFDDVFTTGATLNECAKILKQAGAREVIGVTFART